MLEYNYISEKEFNLNEIEKKTRFGGLVLVFRLKNDFISQLTVEKLLKEDNNEIKIYDIQLDKNTRMLGNFHLKRLPKFYFYQNGEILETLTGNISNQKLKERISNFY